jgi:hypothetical protein
MRVARVNGALPPIRSVSAVIAGMVNSVPEPAAAERDTPRDTPCRDPRHSAAPASSRSHRSTLQPLHYQLSVNPIV